MTLTRTQREVLEQLALGTRMSAFLPRSRARTVSVLMRSGLIARVRAIDGVWILGKYRLTSRGWAAAGKAPCKRVTS